VCSEQSHTFALNDLAASIATACISAASSTIPQTKNKRESRRIPDWNGFVAPYQTKSLFWHNICVECERPWHGVVADIMRHTRSQYHRAIRRVKINERNIISEKFTEAVIENRGRDFWSEVKRVRRTHPSVSSVIDGLSQPEDKADVFASKYQDLYTGVSYNSESMDCLRNGVHAQLTSKGYDQHCVVSSTAVSDAIIKLNEGKGDGITELSTDHFKNACTKLSVYVSFLFSGLLTHGTFPTDLVTSTIIHTNP